MTRKSDLMDLKSRWRPSKLLTVRVKKDAVKDPSKPDMTTHHPAHQNVHILLVEDHAPTLTALTQLLQNRHYRITSTASCAEARSSMKKCKDFQLLISDIGLPDGSGHNLMVEFHKKFSGKGIALTGYGLEHDIAQSQAAGFTTHLVKPIRVESLDNALEVVLKAPAKQIFLKNGMPRNAA